MTRNCEHTYRAGTWRLVEHNPAGSLLYACPHDGCDGRKRFSLRSTRRNTYYGRFPLVWNPTDDGGGGVTARVVSDDE